MQPLVHFYFWLIISQRKIPVDAEPSGLTARAPRLATVGISGQDFKEGGGQVSLATVAIPTFGLSAYSARKEWPLW